MQSKYAAFLDGLGSLTKFAGISFIFLCNADKQITHAVKFFVCGVISRNRITAPSFGIGETESVVRG